MIKDYLENNYQDRFDYTFLAKYSRMNTNSLSIAFRALTNSSIHEYLTIIRVNRSKKLLETTDLSITLIAARVGLDKSNLYIQFKKLTGITPLQWRKNAILNNQTEDNDPLSRNEDDNKQGNLLSGKYS